jgi:hypothetical protein
MRGRIGATVAVLTVVLLATLAGLAGAVTEPVGPDPVVKRWAKWPYRVACSRLTFDPVKAFSRPTRAESGSGQAELALRGFLRAPAAAEIPKDHWRLLAKTATRAEFGHGRLEGEEGVSVLGLTRQGDEWVTDEPRRCRPRTIRDGIMALDWALPATPLPDPSADFVVIGIHEWACTGSRNPIPHVIRPPYVRYGKKSVAIAVWVRPPEGPQTCPGNPIGWLRVKLPGPLGARALYDRATYPPRAVQPGEDPRRLPRP